MGLVYKGAVFFGGMEGDLEDREIWKIGRFVLFIGFDYVLFLLCFVFIVLFCVFKSAIA